MSTALILPGLILSGIAILMALIGWLQYRLSARLSPELRAAVLLGAVGLGALLSVVFTSRTLNEAQFADGFTIHYEDLAEGFAASRWLSLLLLGFASIEIFRGWILSRSSERADPARAVLFALLAYYLGTVAVQLFASEHTGFSYRSLYLPILLTSACYLSIQNIRPVLETAKWAMALLIWGSLVAAVFTPDFVLHRPEPGLLPGIDWRLYGLTSHANTLAPIALLAIIVEVYSPSRLLWLRWMHLLAASAVLTLTQSKTSWAAMPIILALVYLPFRLRPGRDAAETVRRFSRVVWTLVAFIIAVVVLIGFLLANDAVSYLQRNADLDTLTGRTPIWDITLRAWRENLLFGFGPEVWGAERRSQFLMFHVGHAHNQVMQTLGEAGLIGLALLLAYLGTLTYAATKKFSATHGILLAVLIVMLVRCVTEAPMRAEGLLSWATFLHLLLVLLTCHALRQPRQAVQLNPA